MGIIAVLRLVPIQPVTHPTCILYIHDSDTNIPMNKLLLFLINIFINTIGIFFRESRSVFFDGRPLITI